MATFDVAGDGSVVFATTTITSASFTIAATANRAAVVSVYHSGNSATGISVTVGGVSGTLISGTDTGTAQTPRTFQYVVINPPSGSQTATCSWTGNNDAYLKVAVYNDVDQTTPAINGTFASGATGAPSLTPTAGAGNASVVCMASGGDAGATQTLIGSTLSGTSQDFTATRGTAGATHSWNNFFTTYVMSGCVLQSPSVAKELAGTGGALALAGGEGSLARSLISGDFFVGKFFGGGFFTAATGNPSLTGTGGALALTGGTATLRADRVLVGSGGVLTLSGGTATVRKDFRITATGGALALTGGTAAFAVVRALIGTGGALTLTGGTAALRADRILVGAGGAIALTGGSATLRADRILLGAGGALALTGGDATMQAGGNVSLDGAGGALVLTGGEASFATSGVATATGPTPAGGIISGKRRKRVVIGEDVYDVESLRDVEFLLKRVVRTEAPPRPKKRRTKVVDRVYAKVTPEAVVEASVPSIAVNWAPLWRQLAAQDQEYANALVKALERQEEDDIETLLMAL